MNNSLSSPHQPGWLQSQQRRFVGRCSLRYVIGMYSDGDRLHWLDESLFVSTAVRIRGQL